MQDQINSTNRKQSRQEYNKRYYEQNKKKILEKRKGVDQGTNVLQLFDEGDPSKPSSKFEIRKFLFKMFRLLEFLTFFCLSAVMTYLLLKESAGFYLDSNDTQVAAYLKAGMVELTAVLFSFSRSRHLIMRWGQRLVVVLLCGLSLWTMSGRVVKNASQDTTKVQTSLQIIRELEAERDEKEALRQQFLSRGWLHRTRIYESGLDEIRGKLIQARQSIASMQAPHVIANSLGVLIAFRLVFLISNLICIHRLVELFEMKTARQLRN